MPSRYLGPGGGSLPRPAPFPWRLGGQHQREERGELRSRGSPYTCQPQATPPCCLGSLALGQPCAEAMERDVPLAEGGVGYWALCQTVPPGYQRRHGEGWAVRLRGSLHQRGKDWPGPQCPAPEPLPPQGLQRMAGSLPHPCPPGTSPVVWMQNPI